MKRKLQCITTGMLLLCAIACKNPWMSNIVNDEGGNTTTFTVTFNSMGGTSVTPITGLHKGDIITEPTAPSSNYGTFAGWCSDPGRTVLYSFSAPVTGTITLYAKWNAHYTLGMAGPGGGKIFCRSETGFTMTDDNSTAYYLQAAPANGSNLEWASLGYTTTSIPDTETILGAGRKNTARILAVDTNAPAAKACRDIGPDWFLPSTDELYLLYEKSYLDVTLGGGFFWSSSQYNSNNALYQSFSGGSPGFSGKGSMLSVRAIRAF